MADLNEKSIDFILGQQLKKIRSLRQIPQQQLAEFLGITFQQIQKYEKGVNRMPASRLFRISWHLDAPLPAFFGTLYPVDPGNPLDLTQAEIKILGKVRQLEGTPLYPAIPAFFAALQKP